MVSFYFHPDYSGSAVQAFNLSKRLQSLGVAPFILSANLSGSAAFEAIDGIPVHRVAVSRSRELQIPSFWFAAARFFAARRRDIDIIHAHGTVQHGVVGPMGRILRRPTILKIAMANSDLAFPQQGRVHGTVNRLMVQRFDRYIATTAAIAAEMEERGLDPARVRLIPNGVDTDRFAPRRTERAELRRQLGLPDGPIACCVAIVNGRKNIDGLLRIWEAAVRTGAPGHLIVIGPVQEPGGHFHRELLRFIAQHRLGDRVSLLGQRAAIADYLAASDLFLFPSRQEGMPNSVLEAMASGLPCLLSRSAGTEDLVVDREDGLLLDPDDERLWTDEVVQLLHAADRRHDIGAAARRRAVERFSLNAVAGEYVRLYQELVAS